MTEAFGCGTAAGVTPIFRAVSEGAEWTIGGGAGGPVAERLRRMLTDVQRGRVADTRGWLDRIPTVGLAT
jgi:branched-chain amino acid aminotransferase